MLKIVFFKMLYKLYRSQYLQCRFTEINYITGYYNLYTI